MSRRAHPACSVTCPAASCGSSRTIGSGHSGWQAWRCLISTPLPEEQTGLRSARRWLLIYARRWTPRGGQMMVYVEAPTLQPGGRHIGNNSRTSARLPSLGAPGPGAAIRFGGVRERPSGRLADRAPGWRCGKVVGRLAAANQSGRNMSVGGVWGKILHVNLTDGRSWVEQLPDEVYLRLVGGRALVALSAVPRSAGRRRSAGTGQPAHLCSRHPPRD